MRPRRREAQLGFARADADGPHFVARWLGPYRAALRLDGRCATTTPEEKSAVRLVSMILSVLIALSVALSPVSSLGAPLAGGHAAHGHAHAHDHVAVSFDADPSPASTSSGVQGSSVSDSALGDAAVARGLGGEREAGATGCCELGACHSVALAPRQESAAALVRGAPVFMALEHQAISSDASRIERPPRAG